MVRCKCVYLCVVVVCVGVLYLIYIFGMLEKILRIVCIDVKDLNGISNIFLYICLMILLYFSK